MASILFKWLLIGGLVFNPSTTNHPIYVSVTEIEHNAKEKTLEISCKIFTDDFEKALKATYKTYVDLLKPKNIIEAANVKMKVSSFILSLFLDKY